MNTKLISMFNVALEEKGAENNFAKINEKAMKVGYFIHPNCCTKDVAKWLTEQSVNYNSTFYKTWEDVTSKNRFELFVDQILHYCTTYGTDFALGNGYVPNSNPVEIPFEKFKVIIPISADGLFEKIMDMLKSGVALKSDTINVFIEFFREYHFIDKINIDEIKNKEAQAIISNEIGKLPNDEFGMLRAIVYKYTQSAMLIKSNSVIYTIKCKNGFRKVDSFDFSKLSNEQLKKLSRIFYRYKPIFLAMKDSVNAPAINKIRKYAKVYHKPLVKGFWETCLTKQDDLETAKKTVGELNNFRKVQLMQSIKERLLSKNDTGKMFIIRNGKMFIREDYKSNDNAKYLIDLYRVLEKSLVDSLSSKACKIRLPKGVVLTCPTSEKNFIGNFPIGSYVPMNGHDNMFGIYWKNGWGARDLDLWYTDKNGGRYGWCSDYYDADKTIVFSGDMTNADPEAAEIFYLGSDCTDGNVGVNIYSRYDYHSNKEIKFRLFIANEPIDECFKHNGRRDNDCYMVNPNSIVFSTELEFGDEGLKKIGIIHDNKLFFVDLGAGYERVSTTNSAEIINRQMFKKVESCVELSTILQKAGFTILENDDIIDSENEDVILDFTNLSKNDLIDLFA